MIRLKFSDCSMVPYGIKSYNTTLKTAAKSKGDIQEYREKSCTY